MKLDLSLLNQLALRRDKNNFIYLKGSSHRIKIPQLDTNLALFLGLLWGDGWVVSRQVARHKSRWRIGLVEDDKLIIERFIALSESIFSVKPLIHFRKTKYEVYINSRIVYEILTRIFKFPDGRKKGKLKVPNKILSSKSLIISFLRGLFSTDGRFTIYKNYPRIGVDSATYRLIKDVEGILKKLGFNPKTYTWNRKNGNRLFGLYLNGKKNVQLFYKEINFIGEKAKKLKNYIDITAPK